jgi:SAM-dependent methyltransferase
MPVPTAYDAPFFARHQPGIRASARVIVPLVIDALAPQSVVDVGCGTGEWLAAFAERGVHDIRGYDGDYVRGDLTIPEARFEAVDLRRPLRANRRFELALSLEVAEHLPSRVADDFVASLVALAPAVLFSAAIPFQGGTHHLNEQWPDYWASRFGDADYLPVDFLRPRIWSDSHVEWWYAQNCILFANTHYIAERSHLVDAVVRDPEQLSLVHPKNYLAKCDPDHTSARNAFGLLWRTLRARTGSWVA